MRDTVLLLCAAYASTMLCEKNGKNRHCTPKLPLPFKT
ncbi:hypothetical protein RA11412_0544 [Rothia aeria]|uniref:Uncharacterized protein n=1 Tax=Rothia aeria TaxID=172042 RepID=A0A2Z5QWX8_9MICC|nr:hypothetical protein RA11412_0544 [Rothia aeria]